MSPETVENGNSVKVLYTGKLDDGTVFDSSERHGGDPLEFTVGEGRVIKGFDTAVIGMKVGDEKEFKIEPVDAYGERDPTRVQKIPKSELPPGQEPQIGMLLQFESKHEDHVHQMICEIVEVGEEDITIDMNHPLAGKALTFEIKLVEIQ